MLIEINHIQSKKSPKKTAAVYTLKCDHCNCVFDRRYLNSKAVKSQKHYCCKTCKHQAQHAGGTLRQKTNLTCQEKYGVDSVFKSEEIKDKIRSTMIEKYGVEHALQSEIFKSQFRESCLKSLGVPYPMMSQSIKKKSIETCIEKYGVTNASMSEEVKTKTRDTNNKRFGVPVSSQSDVVKEKAKATCMSRYGCEWASQSESSKEKSRQTCLQKYGVEYTHQCLEILDKATKTSLSKHAHGYVNVLGENVYFRSSYEKVFLEWCHSNEQLIVSLRSNIRIPYDFEGSKHYYFLDFEVVFKHEKKFLCEIKPAKMTSLPVNVAKFQAASAESKQSGSTFVVIDELALADLTKFFTDTYGCI